jgi:antitoxin MazE
MDVQIAKWGNSLAIRIPRRILKEANLQLGDYVSATLSQDGSVNLRTKHIDRKTLIRQLHDVRESMPMTKSVIQDLRGNSRY